MKTIVTLMLITAFSNAFAQTIVYDSAGRVPYIKEDVDLKFSESSVFIKSNPKTSQGNQESLAAVATLLPAALDLGFKVVTDILEKREAKFSGEYQVQKSYLNSGSKNIPELTFIRKVTIKEDGKTITKTALSIELKPKAIINEVTFKVKNGNTTKDSIVKKTIGFIYYVSSIELAYSKAKWKTKYHVLDYTLEINPTLWIDGEKKAQELAPISMTGIEFGKQTFEEGDAKFRTAFIPTPEDALFLDAGIKIVETNPTKIKAEKILDVFNDYQGDIKDMIKHFIPSDEE